MSDKITFKRQGHIGHDRGWSVNSCKTLVWAHISTHEGTWKGHAMTKEQAKEYAFAILDACMNGE